MSLQETLDALRKDLYDNSIYEHSNYSFDIKYAYQLFSHMYNIYSNDMLNRPLTETEYVAYVWTPLIRYAFMEQDIRISSGEVGSLAYEKLKKISQQQSKSGFKSNDYIDRNGCTHSGKCEN
ncbi:13982_t:CDS:2 [Funneliformis mosseae]|uniref:13982_t:CDS:1 n=1 Tax=Funneliformis mosseae TaxID=27381 RepID=A0A9N9BSU1_FUNMO|nr:13982_t:CDS:2 [Funneliformis mosseae]